MKKFLTVTVLIVVFGLLISTKVLAAEPQILIEGDSTAKPGESKEVTIKVSSDTEIGVVSGKIETSSNINNVTVTGMNGWNLTYNKDTGVFNVYKAEGAKSEAIINIKYTAGSEDGTGNITLSNVKATTISYESKELGNITKNIQIAKEKTEQEPEKEPEQKLKQESEQKPEQEPEQKQIQEIEPETKKTDEKKKDTTIKDNKKIPDTGKTKNVYVVILVIIVLSIVIGICYYKSKKGLM